MTKRELSRLYYLNKEIAREKSQLAELRGRGTSATARVTGLPHCSGIGDKVGNTAIELADLEALIDTHCKQATAEYARLNLYIQAIDDPQMRLILSLRYVYGLSWRQVAVKLGGGNTANGVYQRHKRFLLSENGKGYCSLP